MAIRIEKISVKNCGPIANFQEEFKDLNLIYSENEKGKSFLVEFIIHSLFKNKSFWRDLRNPGQGKVFLSGLEKSITEFSPLKRKKLEDYLTTQKKGLPPLLANLLVIKEGETDIVKNEHGLDKNSLKEILSPRRVLDEIDSDRNISVTIKRAKLENGEIVIDKRGEGQTYHELREKLSQLESLINQIINQFEQGDLKSLEIIKERLKSERELLIKAKRYEAFVIAERLKKLKEEREKIPSQLIENLNFLISEYTKKGEILEKLESEIAWFIDKEEKLNVLYEEREILLRAKAYEAYILSRELEDIEIELNQLPEEELIELKEKISRFFEKAIERQAKERACEELREISKDYIWLKSAKETYERIIFSNYEKNDISKISLLSAFLFALSLLLIFFEYKTLGLIINALSFLSLIFILYKFKNFSKTRIEELKGIKEDFFKRTNRELSNISQIIEILNKQESASFTLATYEKELDKLNMELKLLENEIANAFKSFGFENIERERWQEKFSQLKHKRSSMLSKYQRLKASFNELNVLDSEFEIKDPGVKFDKEKLNDIVQQISGLEKLKEQAESKLKEKSQVEKNLTELEEEIKKVLNQINVLKVEGISYIQILRELEKYVNSLDSEITKLEGLLKGLGVSERDYLIDAPDKSFSQEELDRIEQELAKLEEKISKRDQELVKLKERIIQVTGVDISANWNELIERVYLKREQVRRELEELEAKILAGLLVHNKILELQREEDEKLYEKLNSSEITGYIEKITGRYKNISFEENDIIISDEHFNFKLNELSTGAKEQLMIALRIAFARALLNEKTAFLIFDDAFQHSDYKKRAVLVKTLIELSQQGWQVFYLTMDEHMRELFRLNSENLNFKEISLN